MVRELTAKEHYQMSIMKCKLNERQEDVFEARLAMLLHNENPIDESRISTILSMPLAEYSTYISPLTKQLKNNYGWVATAEHGVTIHRSDNEEDDIHIRPLVGRDLRKVNTVPTLNLIELLSGLPKSDIEKLPIAVYQDTIDAVAFLFAVGMLPANSHPVSQ